MGGLLSWLAEDIPTTRMLELARQDPAAPYTGGASTFYRFVAKLRAERDAGAAPVIRFEGLPGEYVQWDWGEARVRLGGAMIKRVFLAGRLKYSRVSAIRWRACPTLRRVFRYGQQVSAVEIGFTRYNPLVPRPETLFELQRSMTARS